MQYTLSRESLQAGQLPGDTVSLLPLFDRQRGCEKFAQRLLRFAPGASRERLEPDADEVGYVLEGRGILRVGEERAELGPGSGLYLAAGSAWSLEAQTPLELVSVLVHGPEPAGRSHA